MSKGATQSAGTWTENCACCIWDGSAHCNTDPQLMIIVLAAVQIAKWEAADALFNLDADLFSNTLKLRQAGYDGARLDTKTNFYERFEEMADRLGLPMLAAILSCSCMHASIVATSSNSGCYCTPVAICQAQPPAMAKHCCTMATLVSIWYCVHQNQCLMPMS